MATPAPATPVQPVAASPRLTREQRVDVVTAPSTARGEEEPLMICAACDVDLCELCGHHCMCRHHRRVTHRGAEVSRRRSR